MTMTAATRTINKKVINVFNTYDLMFNLFSIPNSSRHQNATQNSLFPPKYFEDFSSANKTLGQNSLCQTRSA